MPDNWARVVNKKVDELALTITPPAAYELSTSYAEAIVAESKPAFERFYKAFQENTHLPNDIISQMKSDPDSSLSAVSIIATLSEKTKDPEAKGAIKSIDRAVYNIMKVTGRT